MTEGTKALNSSVSTLKKNPGRVGRLVKAAKLLIVPPKQYATGKAKEALDAAVAKLKSKRGLNGVVGEGAGPFSDKALQKKAEDEGKKVALGAAGGALAAHALTSPSRSAEVNHRISRMGRRKGRSDLHRSIFGDKPPKRDMLKFDETATRRMGKVVGRKARSVAGKGALAGAVLAGASMLGRHMKKEASMNKDTKDKTLAASAVGSGAALGGVLTHDAKKSRVASRMGTKGAYKHMGDSSVAGAEKRLANSAKTLRRMGKPLRRAGVKGAIVGGLAGAALGAAHLKKEAGVLNSRTVQQRAQQAFQHYKNRDARVAALKVAGKKAAIVAGVAGAGAAVTKKNEQLKKQASELVIKDGKKYRKGTVASAANKMSVVGGVVNTLKGGNLKSFAKHVVKGAVAGGAYGTVRGANRLRKGEISLSAEEMKKLRSKGLAKKAAELLHHNGEDIRRGTIGSAAGKMALLGATLGGIGGLAGGPVGLLAGAALGAGQAAITGGLYGIARGALRAQDGEKSMAPAEFDKLKAKLA